MQLSNRRWHTFCVPQWARACEHVARCWADASPENIASRGMPSMATRAVATIRRAIIRSPQNADRAQILWRDCKAGQYPDGMCSFAPTFSARDQIELPLTGPIRQKCHTSVLSDSRLLPKARRSRYLAGITICQNRGDTSAHESPGPTTAGASLFFWPAATLRAAHDRRGSAVQADGRFQR